MTIIIKGDNYYDYYCIPHLKLAGNPPSGNERHRTRRMLELRKRKDRFLLNGKESVFLNIVQTKRI